MMKPAEGKTMIKGEGLKAMPINIPRMAVNNIHVTQVQEKYFTEIHVDDNYCSIFAV